VGTKNQKNFSKKILSPSIHKKQKSFHNKKVIKTLYPKTNLQKYPQSINPLTIIKYKNLK